MTLRAIALTAAVALLPADATAQDKGGEARDDRIGDAYWEEGPEVDVAPADRIIAMGDGETIFMDRRRPGDRGAIIAMGDGDEI